MSTLDSVQQPENLPGGTLMSFAQALDTWGRTRTAHSAIRISGSVLTYGELNTQTAIIAGALRQLGIAKGDRIAYLSTYRLELLLGVLAGYRVGAINVVLNEYLKGDPLRHQLGDTAPTVIMVDADGLAVLLAARFDSPELKAVVVIGDDAPTPTGDFPFEIIDWRSLTSGPPLLELDIAGPDDPAHIVYTSGTTGLPKGCVLSQRYLFHQGEVFGPWVGLLEDDVYMSSAALYHVSGLHVLTAGFYAGATVAIEPRFSASLFWERVRQSGATVFHGLGFTTIALLAQPEREDDGEHSLRLFWTGAAPSDAKERFEKRFGVRVIGGGYGQTEFNPISMVTPEFPPADRNSMGRPLDHVELKLVDHSGNEVGEGETGEILVRPIRNGVMFSEYWRQPEATLKLWRGLWHRTGDLAWFDESKNLQYAGRVTDSMRRRGENVSAYQVEQAIVKWPKVREVAVFGVQLDTEVDDTIKADIVLEEGTHFDLKEFAEFVNNELPYYATPRFVEVLEALPRTPTGKITKHTLSRDVTRPKVFDLHESGLEVTRSARRGVWNA